MERKLRAVVLMEIHLLWVFAFFMQCSGNQENVIDLVETLNISHRKNEADSMIYKLRPRAPHLTLPAEYSHFLYSNLQGSMGVHVVARQAPRSTATVFSLSSASAPILQIISSTLDNTLRLNYQAEGKPRSFASFRFPGINPFSSETWVQLAVSLEPDRLTFFVDCQEAAVLSTESENRINLELPQDVLITLGSTSGKRDSKFSGYLKTAQLSLKAYVRRPWICSNLTDFTPPDTHNPDSWTESSHPHNALSSKAKQDQTYHHPQYIQIDQPRKAVVLRPTRSPRDVKSASQEDGNDRLKKLERRMGELARLLDTAKNEIDKLQRDNRLQKLEERMGELSRVLDIVKDETDDRLQQQQNTARELTREVELVKDENKKLKEQCQQDLVSSQWDCPGHNVSDGTEDCCQTPACNGPTPTPGPPQNCIEEKVPDCQTPACNGGNRGCPPQPCPSQPCPSQPCPPQPCLSQPCPSQPCPSQPCPPQPCPPQLCPTQDCQEENVPDCQRRACDEENRECPHQSCPTQDCQEENVPDCQRHTCDEENRECPHQSCPTQDCKEENVPDCQRRTCDEENRECPQQSCPTQDCKEENVPDCQRHACDEENRECPHQSCPTQDCKEENVPDCQRRTCDEENRDCTPCREENVPGSCQQQTRSCTHSGFTYNDGDSWRPVENPCDICSCSEGHVRCEREQCYTACRNPAPPPPDSCCPVCDGCGVNGQDFPNGAVIPIGDPCQVCRCMAGEVTCENMAASCPTPPCSHPAKHRGQCCPTCNECEYEQRVYADGTAFTPAGGGPCLQCRCKGGNVLCNEEKCPPVHCSNPIRDPHHCCPICKTCVMDGVEYEEGSHTRPQCPPTDCHHPTKIPGLCCSVCDSCTYNHHVYSNGQRFTFPEHPCYIYTCQRGTIVPERQPCPSLNCRDSYTPPGECCPKCPDQ